MNENSDPRLVKIGELLIRVGALTSGDLTEAIQIAKRMGVPIGRVLVMSGCVTEGDLQQALELQSLIKDSLVDLETGCKALDLVFKQKIDLRTALKKFNWEPKRDAGGNKLGDLLVDSTIVTRAQLDHALEASFQSGMPLGGTLVLQGVISAQLLPTVLHVQEQIRNENLSREDAVEELKQALMLWARAQQSKQETMQGKPAAGGKKASSTKTKLSSVQTIKKGEPIFEGRGSDNETKPAPATAKKDNISLVELLKLSGFCTQETLDNAMHQALEDSRLASKLLMAIGFIDSDTINSYVHLQALIAKGKLRTDQALYVLNSMRYRKLTLQQALAEMGVAAVV